MILTICVRRSKRSQRSDTSSSSDDAKLPADDSGSESSLPKKRPTRRHGASRTRFGASSNERARRRPKQHLDEEPDSDPTPTSREKRSRRYPSGSDSLPSSVERPSKRSRRARHEELSSDENSASKKGKKKRTPVTSLIKGRKITSSDFSCKETASLARSAKIQARFVAACVEPFPQDKVEVCEAIIKEFKNKSSFCKSAYKILRGNDLERTMCVSFVSTSNSLAIY